MTDRATLAAWRNLLGSDLNVAEMELKDERENVKALTNNRDAARARVEYLETRVAHLKSMMEHLT